MNNSMERPIDETPVDYEGIMQACPLRVNENQNGPGFYVGDKDDPEMMEFAMNEDEAYRILEDMEIEYFENNCK